MNNTILSVNHAIADPSQRSPGEAPQNGTGAVSENVQNSGAPADIHEANVRTTNATDTAILTTETSEAKPTAKLEEDEEGL